MQSMEETKRKLVESGVIPRVLDDFNPRMSIVLFYGDTRISIGDEVTLDEVQRPPIDVQHGIDPFDVHLQQTSSNLCLVASVMTDPDAPEGEYLHLLSVQFLSAGIVLPPTVLVTYEPPRSGARMLVLTIFKIPGLESITRPMSRKNFCTRAFGRANDLGSPLGAFFFNIKYENEDEKQKNENTESSTSISSNREEEGQTRNPNITE